MQRSAFSAMGCVNAEIAIFYILAEAQQAAADARGKRSNVNEPFVGHNSSVLHLNYLVNSLIMDGTFWPDRSHARGLGQRTPLSVVESITVQLDYVWTD